MNLGGTLILLMVICPLGQCRNPAVACKAMARRVGDFYLYSLPSTNPASKTHEFQRSLFEMSVCPQEWLRSVSSLSLKQREVLRQDFIDLSPALFENAPSSESCISYAIQHNDGLKEGLHTYRLLNVLKLGASAKRSISDCGQFALDTMKHLLEDWPHGDGDGVIILSDEILLTIAVHPSSSAVLFSKQKIYAEVLDSLDESFTDFGGQRARRGSHDRSEDLGVFRKYLYMICAERNTPSLRPLMLKLEKIRITKVD